MKTCPNCNVTVTSEQRRCGNCGHALTPTHISARRTEPVYSPPPTYIPPPSPHPPTQSRLFPAEVKLLLRPRWLIAGLVVLVLIGITTFVLTRPPQLAGQWYGTLGVESGQGIAANGAYAGVYLNLQIDSSGTITGSGEFCTLASNPNETAGRRSPFTVSGNVSGAQVVITLSANRYGGSPGSTRYVGGISGQRLGLQIQTSDTNGAGTGLVLQHGTRVNYEASCAG